ncbi:MAG: ribosome recycling factor [Clostridiales bacterium]|jgi:ribosome recycling factor|nr:ribosome recycling factor [Clostridiales bacterium]
MDNAQVTETTKKFEQRSEKSIEFFKTEMQGIRAGRANPHLLDKVLVNYYGNMTPLNQMANVSVPEARLMTVTLWDASALKEVNKALLASNLGITPSDDGKIIRLVFPQLTEDRRKELVKQIKRQAEDSKVILRNERRDCLEIIKKLKKDSVITEDDLAQIEKSIQKATDKFIADIDKILAEKEKEILEV